jgi:glycosyltransferase involved in cell wall biosynthesis
MHCRRLYLVSPRDMRKNRADCVHMMKVCQQFAGQGYDVVLVTPRVFRAEYHVAREDIFQLYGLSETFRIVELPTLLTDRTPNWLSRIQKAIVFGLFYLAEIIRGRLGRAAILYCKCYISTFPAIVLRRLGLLKCRMFFEKAEFTAGNRSHRFTAENVDGIICGNQYIHDKTVAEYAIPCPQVHRLAFGTQFPEIAAHLAAHPAPDRETLGLPVGKRLVMYAGKIGPGMLEIRYILESAKLVPEVEFVLLGVNDDSRPWLTGYLQSNQLRNVTLIGFQPLTRLYDYVNSADVLLSYYDSFDQLSVTQRGPAKASVYLSFGKPVIMADLPSLREWWTDEQIFFVPPDRPDLLAEKIRFIFAHPEEARKRALQCREFAKANTYETSYAEVGRFMESDNLGVAVVGGPVSGDPHKGTNGQSEVAHIPDGSRRP